MKKYIVWCPGLGGGPEHGREITAHDHEDAACQWARRSDADSADYWIAGGDGTTVVVRDSDGDEQTLCITGEPDINYRARVINARNEPDA